MCGLPVSLLSSSYSGNVTDSHKSIIVVEVPLPMRMAKIFKILPRKNVGEYVKQLEFSDSASESSLVVYLQVIYTYPGHSTPRKFIQGK